MVTTCKGRLHHLKKTLPRNIKHAGENGAVFVLLDYFDTEDLGDYIARNYQSDIESGRLVYYRTQHSPRFHMAHAKNMAHRCALLERSDILVTLDSDNLTNPGFADYIAARFADDPELSLLCPDFKALPPRGKRYDADCPTKLGRGFAGRLAIRAQDFVKVGGYNEIFETWRGEDLDLLARLNRLGLKRGALDPFFLHAIAHDSETRFKEYPEAEAYENDDIYGIIERAHDTVVNNGVIGCGVVYRNFSDEPITLKPLPTRVFGIGMQRTGTSSLHEAFQLLGFDSGHWKSAEWAGAIWREMNKWGRSRTLELDYALCDNPIPLLYRRLDEAYPGSKFILTVRDEDVWLESCRMFWTYDWNPRRWSWDIDGFSHKMHGITYGTIDFNEDIFRERYRRHNAEVLEYFKGRDDLLCIEVNENASMAPLCEFLGVPVVDAPFPHQNKGPDMPVMPPSEEDDMPMASKNRQHHHHRRLREGKVEPDPVVPEPAPPEPVKHVLFADLSDTQVIELAQLYDWQVPTDTRWGYSMVTDARHSLTTRFTVAELDAMAEKFLGWKPTP
jgi:hypothetical protein